METFNKTLLLVMMLLLPAICVAQPEACKVTYTGKQPSIRDFVRAYCSQCDDGSFEKTALAAIISGNSKHGKTECVVDTQNGYVNYTAPADGELTTLEMCYWNCDNKNEKLVAVNTIYRGMGFDESYLSFYRYNVKTKTMRLIETPFDRFPSSYDLINPDKVPKDVVGNMQNSQNEDANKFQPSFSLPRAGRDITCRMADPTAVPKQYQRECKLIWNGNGFYLE